MRPPRVAAATVVLATIVLPGCGGSSSAEPTAGVRHVHGVAVNPADRAVFVATHAGMFRLPANATELERVGDRLQDTMGFTVVGDDHFLGSGHPDFYKDPDLPPLLGLIESRDAGRSWSSRSMLGRADLHVLRARSKTVVGYDVSKGRLLVSRNGGRTWAERRFDGQLVDLVIDPANSNHLLATSDAQLVSSGDAGRTWHAVSETTGLLAWPQTRHLYLLAADGRVWWSPDAGRHWQARARIGGKPAAIAASIAGRLVAATESGAIKASRDRGRSWHLLARLAGARVR